MALNQQKTIDTVAGTASLTTPAPLSVTYSYTNSNKTVSATAIQNDVNLSVDDFNKYVNNKINWFKEVQIAFGVTLTNSKNSLYDVSITKATDQMLCTYKQGGQTLTECVWSKPSNLVTVKHRATFNVPAKDFWNSLTFQSVYVSEILTF